MVLEIPTGFDFEWSVIVVDCDSDFFTVKDVAIERSVQGKVSLLSDPRTCWWAEGLGVGGLNDKYMRVELALRDKTSMVETALGVVELWIPYEKAVGTRIVSRLDCFTSACGTFSCGVEIEVNCTMWI